MPCTFWCFEMFIITRTFRGPRYPTIFFSTSGQSVLKDPQLVQSSNPPFFVVFYVSSFSFFFVLFSFWQLFGKLMPKEIPKTVPAFIQLSSRSNQDLCCNLKLPKVFVGETFCRLRTILPKDPPCCHKWREKEQERKSSRLLMAGQWCRRLLGRLTRARLYTYDMERSTWDVNTSSDHWYIRLEIRWSQREGRGRTSEEVRGRYFSRISGSND